MNKPTTGARLLAAAANISLEDEENNPGAPAPRPPPRTAPGQAMELQGRYQEALRKIEQLQQSAGTGAPLDLAIADIYKVPGRQRKLTAAERAELKANLQQNVLMHPVVVLPKNEKGYELLSGYNRVEIYEELGRNTIKAVLGDIDAGKADVLAFYTNLLAPSLPDFEKFMGLKSRRDATGFTQEQLSEESGISPASMSRIFSFEGLPIDALDILAAHPHILGATSAAKLAQVSQKTPELVVEAINMLAAPVPAGGKRFTEAQAVAHVTPKIAKAEKMAPVIIKDGRKVFCKIEQRGGALTLAFSDPAEADEFKLKVQKLIDDELKAARR